MNDELLIRVVLMVNW